MSKILLYTSYENPQAYGDRTNQVFGTQYATTNWYFDTGSLAVTTEFAGTYDDFQDSNHPEPYVFDGEFYADCQGTTRRGFVHDGRGGFTISKEPDSLSCNYVPPAPLTCELGSASVRQVSTPTGATCTVSLTGTANGRVRYRLDGGSEQLGPVFYGVLPGAHQVSLRDDGLAGCQRTVSFTVAEPPLPEAPLGPVGGVDFVGQPLWYSVANVPLGADVLLQLYAESAHGAEDFSLVLTLRQWGDRSGQLHFRLDTLLWPLLRAFVPPVQGLATQRCTTSLVNYYVRTTRTVAGQAPLVATSALRTAVRGGLPAEWGQGNYFSWRAGGSFEVPPFLSWQPAGPGAYAAGLAKEITPQQPEWLFWLSPTNPDALCIARTYDQGPGTEPVVDYEYLREPPVRGWQNQLLAIPLGAVRAGYARLRVQVQTEEGRALSPVAWYTFVAETPRTRYLLFTNSLGGVDTVRGEGKLEASLEATTDKSERPARFGDAPATADRQVSDLSASRKLKLAVGWQEPEELAWLQELVLTRELWQHVAGQLRPLDWPKRSLTAYADEPGLRGLLLEFDYAFSPTAYAPGPY